MWVRAAATSLFLGAFSAGLLWSPESRAQEPDAAAEEADADTGYDLAEAAKRATPVRFEAPLGWISGEMATRDAISRANSWAQAAGLELLEVASTSANDDFAETVAALGARESLPSSYLNSEEDALAFLSAKVQPIVDTSDAPESYGFVELDGESLAFRASWEGGGISYDFVVAPSGPNYALVVGAVQSGSASLYRDSIDSAVESISGMSTPVVAYDLGALRMRWAIIFLVLVGAVYGAFLATADRSGEHRRTGMKSLGVMVGLGLLGAAWVYAGLSSESAGLALIETTRGRVAGEIFIFGLGAGVLGFSLGSFLQKEDAPMPAPSSSTTARIMRSTELRRTADGSVEETATPEDEAEAGDGQAPPASS